MLNIIVLVQYYLPGYKAGGPIRSIASLASALGGELGFKIVTLDRDLGAGSPYPDVEYGRWVQFCNAEVMYQRPGYRGVFETWRVLRSVDSSTVLYLNSFFARRFSMLAVWLCWLGLCRPRCVVLAPRGEFSPGALGIKALRKSLYVRIARPLGCYEGVIWHASSEYEADDIAREFPLARRVAVAAVVPGGDDRRKKYSGLVTVATDLPSPSAVERRPQRKKGMGELRIVFVSRVSPMKNLAGALRMLKGIVGGVAFSIYGPAEDQEYWAECKGLVGGLPENVRVEYMGEVAHQEIGPVFAEHDLFLFPTLGENYGHVICESLAAGCPVLISDRTPWRGLEEAGVGWDLPLEAPERWTEVLQRCVDMGEEEHWAMSERARAYARRRLQDPEALEANRRLFRMAFGLGRE